MPYVSRCGLLGLCLAVAGCGPEQVDALTSSSPVAVRAELGQVIVASPDDGSVSLVNTGTGRSLDLDIGAEPSRVALVGARALVTLRGERALAEVDVQTGQLVRYVDTGPEPFGIVANPDGRTVFVSISQADRVEQRDADTLEVLRSFDVPGRPQGLAVHPDGHLLVVASAFGRHLTVVDLMDGSTRALPLPEHTTEAMGSRIQGTVPLDARVTGDPIFADGGDTLVVPALYVDTSSGEIGGETDLQVPIPAQPYYRQPAIVGSMGRFNATLVQYDLDRHGALEGEAQVTSRIVDVAPGSGGAVIRQSIIDQVVESPDGIGWLVSMQAADTVLYVDRRFRETWRRRDRLAFPAASAVTTARGPVGIAVLGPREAYVHERLAGSLADVDLPRLRNDLGRETGRGLLNDDESAAPTAHTFAQPTSSLGIAPLDPDVAAGRSLFFDAISPELGAAGVSCSTCHVDGRTDGLTWTLFNGDRNTPSLAGPVDEAGVITWTNGIASVADEARFTVEHRMGSEHLPDHRARQIAAFVGSTPYPDLPDELDQDAISRGKALFEREDVGCAACHTGPFLTDGEAYDLYGLEGVTTRPLIGIASSPPYLHDGRAESLRDVLESARNGAMGRTGQLSETELDDLETYLRSL